MAGMYPEEQSINMFGEQVRWPSINQQTGKFTDGDFSDPLKKPSFIPAETINLILDNITELIRCMGGEPDNHTTSQLMNLFNVSALPGKGMVRDEHGRAKVATPMEGDDILNINYLVGTIVMSMLNDDELTRRRYLPLEGQVISIDEYRNLFNAVYRGESTNDTVQAFYKCDIDGTRNENGLYFKLPNANGRVIRGAGQGDKIETDRENYYDGGNIGDSMSDAFQGHWHNFNNSLTSPSTRQAAANSSGNASFYTFAQSGGVGGYVTDGVNGNTRAAYETRAASISARICIIY